MKYLYALHVQDYRACGYVKWVDREWDGRAKTVIGDLARKIKFLEIELEKKEAEKHADREKHKMEKKVIARIDLDGARRYNSGR